jgi:hypothetical protein
VAEPQDEEGTYTVAGPDIFGEKLEYFVNTSERSCSYRKMPNSSRIVFSFDVRNAPVRSNGRHAGPDSLSMG